MDGSSNILPKTNGSVVTISVNDNGLNKNFTKSMESLNEIFFESKFKLPSNRVTINIAANDKKSEIPNGILKNGNGNHTVHNMHKVLAQQKSITFGEM